MSIKGTIFKLGAISAVLLAFTAIIFVVFAQLRFDKTTSYSAVFDNVSGLRSGQFVRAYGVEVGKVKDVTLIDDGQHVRVDFAVQNDLQLFQGSTAAIRYLDLIGNRYLELRRGDSDKILPPGGTIPRERTEPALDLDAWSAVSARCSNRWTRTRSTTSPTRSSRSSRVRAAPSATSWTRRRNSPQHWPAATRPSVR